MNRLKWGISLAVALVIGVVGMGSVANAQRFTTYTAKEDTINSSIYSLGESITIRGVVNGDIFCAGQSVTIDATVHGDVICAGQEVTIAGEIDGDVRVAGQDVSISAKVTDSVTVAASEFSLDAPAVVGRDITALGEKLNLKGTVGRDATLNGATGIVAGQVQRDVRFEGTQLELRDAIVKGKVTATSNQDVKKTGDVAVANGIDHKKPEKDSGFGVSLQWYLLALVALTTFGLMIALIAPRTLHGLKDAIGTTWITPMLVGLAASLVLPFLAVMLAITIVGIPLGGFIFLIWIGLMMLSGPVAAYYLGCRLLAKKPNVILRMLVGSTVLITLYFVPIIGFAIMLAAYWTGSGAILLTAKKRLGKPNYALK